MTLADPESLVRQARQLPLNPESELRLQDLMHPEKTEANARLLSRPHHRMWEADRLLKLAGWRTVIASLPATPVIVSNRSGLSARCYSAATLSNHDLLPKLAATVTATYAVRWLTIELTCAPEIAAQRARLRAQSLDLAMRPMNEPQFITAVDRAFRQLHVHVPMLRIDASQGRDRIHAAIKAAVHGCQTSQIPAQVSRAS